MNRREQRPGLVLAGLTLIAVGIAVAVGPIGQDPAYHNFADDRLFFGIPNLLNVVSNVPFLVLGVAGLLTLRQRSLPGLLPELRSAYIALFFAAAGVGIGSSLYHLTPSNATLIWDRLPMAIAFMAFFAIVVGERCGPELARRLLLPLLAIGAGSVGYWWLTEAAGHGDLRWYGLVQFLPMLLIPCLVGLYPSRLMPAGQIWLVLGVYALAKVLELVDQPLYIALGISGHTLKHLVAAGGLYILWWGLTGRKAAGRVQPSAQAVVG